MLWWSSQLQKLRDKRARLYKLFRKTQTRATPHPVGKSQSRIQKSGQNEQERRLGKFRQLSKQ